jgi:2-oxoglutarate ferredoxin oxidoreductase subunit alpha
MTDIRDLVKGNEAVAMGAIDAGCRYYFGYPITPQSDIPEYLSFHLPRMGGEFVQAESEVAAINMLMGAAATGVRAMTSSSSPGISLMQEGISYIAGSEIPTVIVNMSRSGPGLGGIAPSQGDYFQAVKGGGHGDYHLLVLAPNSVQELYDLTILAFDLAEKYRNPVMILGDAMIGQMKEPLLRKPSNEILERPKDWALTGAEGRPQRILKSLYLKDGELTAHNWKLYHKYEAMKQDEIRYEELMTEDAELILVAFGSAARIARTSVTTARETGMKVGLFRPITVFPFPETQLTAMAKANKRFFVVELNTGQMLEDVKIAAQGNRVDFFGKPPGALPTPEEIFDEIKKIYQDT